MFFDSIDGEDERFYTADEFAEYFRQFISNGIFNGGDNLRVFTGGTDMSINIKEGYAWIEGYLYKIENEDLKLTLDAADPILNRIDRIVIRLDKSLEKRYVKGFYIKEFQLKSSNHHLQRMKIFMRYHYFKLRFMQERALLQKQK